MNKINFDIEPTAQDWIVLEAMRQRHNEYIRLHEDEFFDPQNEYRRHVYMPFELIGWETARNYFFQLDLQSLTANSTKRKHKPFFRQTCQVIVDEESVRKMYALAQRRFRKECSITSTKSFYRFFRNLREHGYDVSPAIANALAVDEGLAYQVAAEISRRNKGVFCPDPSREDA